VTELTAAHLTLCDGSDHVKPIGPEKGDPYEGEHGEAWQTGVQDHGTPEQCMCGHLNYMSCPDWLGIDEKGVNPRG
jgi:hypothetical protein